MNQSPEWGDSRCHSLLTVSKPVQETNISIVSSTGTLIRTPFENHFSVPPWLREIHMRGCHRHETDAILTERPPEMFAAG